MAEIEIMEYKAEDRLSCIDLLKRTFLGASDEKTFTWRFESTSRPPHILVCAKDNGKVVSFNSWLCWEFVHNNDKYIGYQSGESATDERYRGKGLFTGIQKYAFELAKTRNIDFFFGYPSSLGYNSSVRAGYRPIGRLHYYIRFVNPLQKQFRPGIDKAVKDLPSFLLLEKNKIIPVNSSRYFRWRYIENPKGYDILTFEEDGNQALFVVTRRRYSQQKFKIGWSEGFMIDCQFSSLDEVFVSNAFKYLDKIYSKKVLYLITFCNPNTAKGKMIEKHFRIRFRSKWETLFFRSTRDSLDNNIFHDYNNWDIMPHTKDNV